MNRLTTPGRVLRGTRLVLTVMTGLTLCLTVPADPPGHANGWKFDVVHLNSGKTLQGLLVQETVATVRLQCIKQNPGERTKIGPVTRIGRHEIQRIDKLGAEERKVLEDRLEKLKPTSEKERMENIELKLAPWLGKPAGGLSYTSEHFVLTSNAREENVRRAAARLEQIYEAYGRFLPPRGGSAQPTQILLFPSLEEYQELLTKQGCNLLNPAFFDPTRNQIVCQTDLQKLGDEREILHKKHQHLLEKLREQEAQWTKEYMGNIPRQFREKLADDRKKIEIAERENTNKLEKAAQRLFQTLYHEAFHAYLASFVYPPSESEVPRWLNEGLAQIFETAILEAGELRVGHADPERLNRVKDALRKNELVAVADLLKAGPDKFLVGHADNQRVSDESYLASWALAFYLTFDRKKLGTPELDQYVRSLKDGSDPLEAFCALAGEPLPAFEKAFRQYLRVLRTDGSTARLSSEKPPGQDR